MRSQFILSEIGIGLKRNLTMTIAVVLTTAVSLVLVGVGFLIHSQVDLMKGYWYDKVEVSVFLCGGPSSINPACNNAEVKQDQRDQIRAELQANPAVKTVYYESKAEAYTNFRIEFASEPALVKDTPPDALPESFRVKLKDPSQFAVVASAVSSDPGVDEVNDARKTLDPIFKLLNGIRKGAFVIAAVSLVASLILIFNTIRVAAFSRRRETGIMRLVGASNLYIRAPFLLEGALAGLVGALLSCAALCLVKSLFIDGILEPAIRFTPFVSWGTIFALFPPLMLLGAVMAIASSFLAIQRHLRV